MNDDYIEILEPLEINENNEKIKSKIRLAMKFGRWYILFLIIFCFINDFVNILSQEGDLYGILSLIGTFFIFGNFISFIFFRENYKRDNCYIKIYADRFECRQLITKDRELGDICETCIIYYEDMTDIYKIRHTSNRKRRGSLYGFEIELSENNKSKCTSIKNSRNSFECRFEGYDYVEFWEFFEKIKHYAHFR